MRERQLKARQGTEGVRSPMEAAAAMARLVGEAEVVRAGVAVQKRARKRKASELAEDARLDGGPAGAPQGPAVGSEPGKVRQEKPSLPGTESKRVERVGEQGGAGLVPPRAAGSEEGAGRGGEEPRSKGEEAAERRRDGAPAARGATPAEGPRVTVGRGHKLIRTGPILWCHRCGAHTEERVGSALAGGCRPVLEGEKSRRASRRNLLLQQRHPVTKKRLEATRR